jgi:hypothetical protein
MILNTGGFADWLDDAERRRRDLGNGGTVWRPERFTSWRWAAGIPALLIGLGFCAAAVGTV